MEVRDEEGERTDGKKLGQTEKREAEYEPEQNPPS